MQVNDGTYRNSTFVLRRFVGGQEKLDGVFPIVERIIESFANQPEITIEEFSALSDQEYLNRLNLFYSYLEFRYPFFNRLNVLGNSGEDQVLCPLDYTIQDRVFVNLDLKLFEVGVNKEAEVDLILTDFNGNELVLNQEVVVEILIKQSPGESFQDWPAIQGEIQNISIPAGTSRLSIQERFVYSGQGDVFNLKVKIVDVSEGENVFVGKKNVVYTKSTEPFFLVNLLSNINESYQDIPTPEMLQQVIDKGDGFVSKDNINFVFEPNVKGRPVLIFPENKGNVSGIMYVQEDIDIFDAGAFDIFTSSLMFDGSEVLFRIYAAKNLIIYPYKVDYRFKFEGLEEVDPGLNNSFPYTFPFELAIGDAL